MESLRVYRGLLANRPLSKLLLGEFVSGIGDWLYIVAIFVVIYHDTGSAAAVGLFGAVRMIPYIVLSIPAGLVADRFDRRLVLLCSDVLRATTMLAMAAVLAVNGPVIVLIALAMVAASGSAFFYPAVGAYIPALARDEAQLGPANSAWAGLGNLSFIIGPALGGVLIAAGGVDLAFILNAASFLLIAVILWTLPPSHAGLKPTTEAAPAESDTAATEAREPTDLAAPAAPAAAASRIPLVPITGLGLIQVIVGFLDGGIQSVTIVLAVTVLNAGEEANGYLNAAIGVGGLIGAVISGVLVLRRHLRNPMLAGILLIAAGVAVLGAVPILGVAMIAIGVSSAGSILLDVVLTTIFQRLVPDALRGRALGFLMTANTVSAAAGAFVMPVLVVALGAPLALGLFAGLTLAGTLVGVAMLGGAASRPVSPFESTLLRVAKLPIFAGVPPARLEAALGHVRPLEVTAGQVIVEQGEPADRFYIIESGAFTVSQMNDAGGSVVLRALGPDEVFGEIGLLNRSVRTATVTADAPGRLLEMDGDDFLQLVGAGGDLRGRLLGLYGAQGGSRTA